MNTKHHSSTQNLGRGGVAITLFCGATLPVKAVEAAKPIGAADGWLLGGVA